MPRGNKKGLHAPWPKGQSGNPAGRPKGARCWHVILRELLEMDRSEIQKLTGIELPKALDKKSLQSFIGMRTIEKAMGGDLKAIEILMDRMDGKARETHAVESTNTVIPLDSIDNPQLKEELLRAELKKLKKKGGEK